MSEGTDRASIPYPTWDDPPKGDEQMQSLAERADEALPGNPMTEAERDDLDGEDLWVGRIIRNTDADAAEEWDGQRWIRRSEQRRDGVAVGQDELDGDEVTAEWFTRFGVDGDGEAYYDPDGVTGDEARAAVLDPRTGGIYLVDPTNPQAQLRSDEMPRADAIDDGQWHNEDADAGSSSEVARSDHRHPYRAPVEVRTPDGEGHIHHDGSTWHVDGTPLDEKIEEVAPSHIDDLDDVDAGSPGEGEVLTYDDGSWTPKAPAGGTGLLGVASIPATGDAKTSTVGSDDTDLEPVDEDFDGDLRVSFDVPDSGKVLVRLSGGFHVFTSPERYEWGLLYDDESSEVDGGRATVWDSAVDVEGASPVVARVIDGLTPSDSLTFIWAHRLEPEDDNGDTSGSVSLVAGDGKYGAQSPVMEVWEVS